MLSRLPILGNKGPFYRHFKHNIYSLHCKNVWFRFQNNLFYLEPQNNYRVAGCSTSSVPTCVAYTLFLSFSRTSGCVIMSLLPFDFGPLVLIQTNWVMRKLPVIYIIRQVVRDYLIKMFLLLQIIDSLLCRVPMLNLHDTHTIHRRGYFILQFILLWYNVSFNISAIVIGLCNSNRQQ